jgi:hypothetical protein
VTPAYSFIGCFQEPWCGDLLDRALGSIAFVSASMTVDQCVGAVAAAGYKYAAVQYGIHCFGGNNISAYDGYANNQICSVPCAGNATQVCGGGCANSIYRVATGKWCCAVEQILPACSRCLQLALLAARAK